MPRMPRTELVKRTGKDPLFGGDIQFIGAKTRGRYGGKTRYQVLGYKVPGAKRFRITSGAVKIRRK